MANGLTKFTLNSAGVKELLQSGDVLADLTGRAERIAAAAGEGMEVDSRVGRGRARASVFTATYAAQVAEATDRALTRAIGSGR